VLHNADSGKKSCRVELTRVVNVSKTSVRSKCDQQRDCSLSFHVSDSLRVSGGADRTACSVSVTHCIRQHIVTRARSCACYRHLDITYTSIHNFLEDSFSENTDYARCFHSKSPLLKLNRYNMMKYKQGACVRACVCMYTSGSDHVAAMVSAMTRI